MSLGDAPSGSRRSVKGAIESVPGLGEALSPLDLEISESQPRVLAVVVVHNGTQWLESCLKSLAAQLYPSLDVVVVDSGSKVELAGPFGEILPKAELVRVERNIGFGAAANVGLEVSAKAPTADYFLFLHDDVELEPEAVSLLISTAMETAAGVIGGKGLEWDHPERLIEVGMSADQFGYPYSNLEPGEIDQGQHDAQRETLFVTSACILVAKAFIERCGLWDGGYFAFAEDLDLCTRARLAGFKVMVQPAARFRHAVALANGIRPVRGMPSVRFLTRRNRLRTIAKNNSFWRMLLVTAMYLPLTLIEICALLFFRRFDEIGAYPKAFASFVASLPDVIRRRRAVQKRRTVSDRRIRQFMVRDSDRARVFFENRLRVWERGTVALGTRTLSHLTPAAIKVTVKTWIRRPGTIATVGILAILGIAMRRFLFSGPVAGGTLLPFPEQTARFMSQYLSAWRDVGLGTESAAPAAFPLYWLAGFLAMGRALVAQKLMMVLFTLVGMYGIHLFVARRTRSVLARMLAVGLYALGPIMQLMVTTADASALALYAVMPFLLEVGLRLLGAGWPKQTDYSWDCLVRDIGRLAILSALAVALAPSAFVALVFLWLLLTVAALVVKSSAENLAARAAGLFLSAFFALIVLIPWSIEAVRPKGAVLAPIFSGRGGTFLEIWSKQNFEQMFLLNPFGRIAGLVTLAISIGVLLLAGETRRRESRSLIFVWIVFALVGGLVTKGIISPPVATPALWLVVPLAITAVLAGHLIAGIKEELPRHAFGWRHKFAVPILAASVAVGVLVAWLPSLPDWSLPEEAFTAGIGEQAESISSFLETTADQVGDFRVLWLGERWIDPIRAGTNGFEGEPYLITGPQGSDMLDTQQPPPSQGERSLATTVDGMVGRKLHLAGHLLAPANVRFIVVDPRDERAMSALRAQRDIALEQQQGSIAIFRNLRWLPRAVLAPVNLVPALTSKSADASDLLLVEWSGGRKIPRRNATRFSGELPRTRHSQILLAENFNSGWRAVVDGKRLEHAQAFGWANRYVLPPSSRGEVSINFNGRPVRILWLMFQAMMILFVMAVARGGRTELPGRLR